MSKFGEWVWTRIGLTLYFLWRLAWIILILLLVGLIASKLAGVFHPDIPVWYEAAVRAFGAILKAGWLWIWSKIVWCFSTGLRLAALAASLWLVFYGVDFARRIWRDSSPKNN
jgi:hypothetical protein